ncbi:MAG TPA: HAD family hydrolase [Kofleriaceae bacterium]|nr:HAD family hydrolase [Kofleriaceae bacterium]
MSLPLSDLNGPVRALFSDLDGTLSTRGRVEASTYAALERLGQAGIPVVLVTGRPAGWGQAIAGLVPLAAVVAENGGVTFFHSGSTLNKIYGVPASSLPEWRRRMQVAAVDVMREIPEARLSSDSKYREVDLAIDWNEEVHLDRDQAERAVEMLRQRGFGAVRSSVHVNFGPPTFDKLSACKVVVAKVLGGDPADLSPYVYVGDALNDAPMFAGFERSIGVANVRRWWDELSHKPNFLTHGEEGAGLREVVDHILAQNR